MAERDLVVGALTDSGRLGPPDLARKLLDFTLACCRFDWKGSLLVGDTVDDLLSRAGESGARYCLVQSAGHAMVRRGDRQLATDTNFIKALIEALIPMLDPPPEEFLVAGSWIDGGERWYGLDELCFVVDLDVYRRLGEPRFTPPADGPRPLPAAGAEGEALRPLPGTVEARPALPGWGFLAASLAAGLPVRPLPATARQCGHDLRPASAAEVAAIARFGGAGVLGYDPAAPDPALGAGWRGFLDYAHLQAKHAKRGVFLGNFESYDDIERPPADLGGPLAGVYAVAAGFKANRILATHGFDRDTRVVFFDYSPVALALRQAIVEEWDGTDFPAFVERIAPRFPDAFYQLWGNLWATRPGALDLELLASIWQRELTLWGGAEAFREHWARYRGLPHRYLHCDLFAAPESLLEALTGRAAGGPEVLWWSNAFHSLNGAWFYDRDDRHRIYRRWLADLEALHPGLWLYGTDVDNLDLLGRRAGDLAALAREGREMKSPPATS